MYQAYYPMPCFYGFNPQYSFSQEEDYRSNKHNHKRPKRRPYNPYDFYGMYPMPFYYPNPCCHGQMNPYNFDNPFYNRLDGMSNNSGNELELRDYGPMPIALDINEATERNDNFRTGLWTGTHLQVTLMSLEPGEDIGLEMHPNVDQFLRIEQGDGIVQMGNRRNNLTYQRNVGEDFAIMVPAGTWHNLTNTGVTPLKLYSIYAPPNHPRGVLHETKEDAEKAEMNHMNQMNQQNQMPPMGPMNPMNQPNPMAPMNPMAPFIQSNQMDNLG